MCRAFSLSKFILKDGLRIGEFSRSMRIIMMILKSRRWHKGHQIWKSRDQDDSGLMLGRKITSRLSCSSSLGAWKGSGMFCAMQQFFIWHGRKSQGSAVCFFWETCPFSVRLCKLWWHCVGDNLLGFWRGFCSGLDAHEQTLESHALHFWICMQDEFIISNILAVSLVLLDSCKSFSADSYWVSQSPISQC